MNDIGIIIQARTGSTRLNSKTIIPFWNEKGILELLLEKLILSTKVPIIVATTVNNNDDKIEQLVNKFITIRLYRGSEENVLNRYIEAATKFRINKIIRICADNPFLELKSLLILINRFNDDNVDYLGFSVNGIPSIKTHYGFWAEGVSIHALIKTSELTAEKKYQEHVTNYIYENSNIFNVDFIEVQTQFNNSIRLTLDTQEDFEIQKTIFKQIMNKYPAHEYQISDIIKYLDNNPEFYKRMLVQINNQKK